jgi:hypothetical protein
VTPPFAHHPKTHSGDVSILIPRIDRSVRRVDGIDMARELRGAYGHVLTPGRYVGTEEIEDDGVPFEGRMAELSSELYEQETGAEELDRAIGRKVEVLCYGR